MTASHTRLVTIAWLLAMAIFVAGAFAVVMLSRGDLDTVDIGGTFAIAVGCATVGAIWVTAAGARLWPRADGRDTMAGPGLEAPPR